MVANTLHVPTEKLEALRAWELWLPIVADARPSLGDLRAIHAYRFDPGRSSGLGVPVILQRSDPRARETST